MMDLRARFLEVNAGGDPAVPLPGGSTMPKNIVFVPQNQLGAIVYDFPTTPTDRDKIEWIAPPALFSVHSMTLTPSDKPVGLTGSANVDSVIVTEDGVTGGFIFNATLDLWEPFVTGFMGLSQQMPSSLVGIAKYPMVTTATASFTRLSSMSSIVADTRATDVLLIFDTDTFSTDDEISIKKPFSPRRLTLQLTRGNILMPDGTTDANPYIEFIPGVLTLIKYDDDNFVLQL